MTTDTIMIIATHFAAVGLGLSMMSIHPANAEIRASKERSGIVVTGASVPIDSVRLLDYPAIDQEGRPITSRLVAEAIANDYVWCSKYGYVQEQRNYLNSSMHGVEAELIKISEVKVAYLNGKGTSDGNATFASRSPMTKSGQDLTFRVIEKGPGQFEWTATPVVEHKGFDLVIPIPFLDTTENIVEDVKRCMQELQPRVQGKIDVTDEIDAPYPAAAVFANYVRLIGKPIEQGVETDTRWGVFKAGKDRDSGRVRVNAYPYRNGSKIRIIYKRTYAVLPGGIKSQAPDEAELLVAKLKKYALE